MNHLIKLIVIALAGYVGYVVWLNYYKPAPPAEIAVAAPTPEPTPIRDPVAAATPPPAPATSAPELAPEGVFYLLARSRVETAEGLVGLPAGTGVKLVRPGIYLTASGEVPLDPALLTNDMGKARAARDAERAAQAAAQARIAAEGNRVSQMVRESAAVEETQAQQLEAANAQVKAQRRARIVELQQQITNARQEKASLQKYKPGNWQARVREKEAEIRNLQQQLSSLGVSGAMLN